MNIFRDKTQWHEEESNSQPNSCESYIIYFKKTFEKEFYVINLQWSQQALKD